VAAANDTDYYGDFDELVESCDALAFCVAPDAQCELAVRAAARGRALLLEKPLALSLRRAEDLVRAVEATGVVTQMVLTWRYSTVVRDFLATNEPADALGARGIFVSDALLGGVFATPWRLEHGALFDLGPHVLDLLEATLGPIRAV